jgi:hypothetical protein
LWRWDGRRQRAHEDDALEPILCAHRHDYGLVDVGQALCVEHEVVFARVDRNRRAIEFFSKTRAIHRDLHCTDVVAGRVLRREYDGWGRSVDFAR